MLHYTGLEKFARDRLAGVLHYIRSEKFARDKHSSSMGPIYELWIKWSVVILHLQHFIAFITNKWTLLAGVLHYIRFEKLAVDRCSSLLDPFMRYEGNKVLWVWHHGPFSQNFIFFIIYKCAQQARVLHYTRLESLARDKSSSPLGPFVSYEENEVLWIWSQKLELSQHLERSKKLIGRLHSGNYVIKLFGPIYALKQYASAFSSGKYFLLLSTRLRCPTLHL